MPLVLSWPLLVISVSAGLSLEETDLAVRADSFFLPLLKARAVTRGSPSACGWLTVPDPALSTGRGVLAEGDLGCLFDLLNKCSCLPLPLLRKALCLPEAFAL